VDKLVGINIDRITDNINIVYEHSNVVVETKVNVSLGIKT
jgi:hypothetical protein